MTLPPAISNELILQYARDEYEHPYERTGRYAPTLERFWSYVNKDGPIPAKRPDLGPCWMWLGGRKSTKWNYGCFHLGYVQGRAIKVAAHRFLYVIEVGPVAEGLELDHLCITPLCVRPSHLEAVTPLVNKQRAPNYLANATVCKRGHPLSGTNVIWRKTYKPSPTGLMRQCLACLRERSRLNQRRYRAAKKGATTWMVTTGDRVQAVVVSARTQAQLERSRKNATNPPPPEPNLRRGRPS